MTSNTPMIQAVRDWLRTCPWVAYREDDGVAFRVEYLGAEPAQFALMDAPGEPELGHYADGSTVCVKNYVLASRETYGPDIAQAIANSGLWDELAQWVRVQDRRRNFPLLAPGQTPRSIRCTSNAYVIAAEADTCQIQIQLQLEYLQR